MLQEHVQRCALVVGQVDDVEAAPAVLAVGAGPAPQAVCAKVHFADAIHRLGADQTQVPDRVGVYGRLAEEHKAVAGKVDDASQALSVVTVEDFQLQLGVVAAELTTIIHGGSLGGIGRAAGKALQDTVDGIEGAVDQWSGALRGNDAGQALFHLAGQQGQRFDGDALAAVVNKHVVAGGGAEPRELELARCAIDNKLEPGAELNAFQLFNQKLRAGRQTTGTRGAGGQVYIFTEHGAQGAGGQRRIQSGCNQWLFGLYSVLAGADVLQ